MTRSAFSWVALIGVAMLSPAAASADCELRTVEAFDAPGIPVPPQGTQGTTVATMDIGTDLGYDKSWREVAGELFLDPSERVSHRDEADVDRSRAPQPDSLEAVADRLCQADNIGRLPGRDGRQLLHGCPHPPWVWVQKSPIIIGQSSSNWHLSLQPSPFIRLPSSHSSPKNGSSSPSPQKHAGQHVSPTSYPAQVVSSWPRVWPGAIKSSERITMTDTSRYLLFPMTRPIKSKPTAIPIAVTLQASQYVAMAHCKNRFNFGNKFYKQLFCALHM